eukprot:763542-Hanusia_phi.AAC.1
MLPYQFFVVSSHPFVRSYAASPVLCHMTEDRGHKDPPCLLDLVLIERLAPRKAQGIQWHREGVQGDYGLTRGQENPV